MPRRLLSDRKKTFTKNFSFGDSFNYTNFLNDNQEGGAEDNLFVGQLQRLCLVFLGIYLRFVFVELFLELCP